MHTLPDLQAMLPSAEQLAIGILMEISEDRRLRACRSYSELHDHCDANQFEAIQKIAPDRDHLTDDERDALMTEQIALMNQAYGIVDKCLRHGFFRKPGAVPEKHHVDLVVVYDTSTTDAPKVYGPDKWADWCSVVEYDKGTADPEDTDAHHAGLVERGEHPNFPDYREL